MYSPGLIGRNDSSKPNLYLAGFLLPECSVLAEDEEYRPWASVRETVIFPVGTGNLSSIWSAAAVGSAIYLPEMLPHIETGRARRNANGVPAGAVKTLPRSISPMVALTAGPVNAAPIIVPTIHPGGRSLARRGLRKLHSGAGRLQIDHGIQSGSFRQDSL
jgi:hypothetical protein